ncbi:MAG: diphthine--ammonia ligase [Candidatus Pacearchaeota archaeon]|nr:diphthine--ammonia ligase [Candidatus Pacearchaeota archaeon]
MKLGILFSGGKDSCLALYYASGEHEVVCLISLVSENPSSFMFHTPNITLARKQAEAIGLPIIIEKTKGEKEKELIDLEKAIRKAKEKYKIEGIVTGALASVYQLSRIQKICDALGLACINPLWQKNQFELLNEVVKLKFDVIVVSVAAEGLENFIGRKIDSKFIEDIRKVHERHKIHVAGEGGEFETFVLWAPFFKKRLKILKSHIGGKGYSKVMVLDSVVSKK